MKLQELISIVSGNCSFKEDFKINTIQTNSKDIGKKDVFLAIGNGYHYCDEAIANGAVAIITDKEVDIDSIVIKIEDSIIALGLLAQHYREKYPIPLIAITGSTGKTTTKEFISKLLEKKYRVLKTEKNHNNHIGLPSTLLKLNNHYDLIVTELGMNHLGEISYLSKICKPDVGIITNVGTAHIGNLGSQKNIFKAKLEIVDGMEKGTLIVNGNDRYLKKIKNKKISVLKEKLNKNDLIHNIHYYKDHTEFMIANEYFQFYIPGKHMLQDLLLSIRVALLYQISLEDIKEVVSSLKSEEGRFHIQNSKYMIIDDTYNSSYEAVLESLQYIQKEKQKKIIVLGDMLELGKFSKKYHKKINKKLKKIKHKTVLLIGKETKVIRGKHFDSLLSLQVYLNHILEKDCIVLIKGSRKMGLDKLVKAINN